VPFTHAYFVPIHEAPDCATDLLQNLRLLDATSAIYLFDASDDGTALRFVDAASVGARVVPNPSHVDWGRMMPFLMDCSRQALADDPELGAATWVDSDMLLLRPGYADMLARTFAEYPNAGALVTDARRMSVEEADKHVPTKYILEESEVWRPFIERFGSVERDWGRWSFMPATVFSGPALRSLVDLWDHDDLADFVGRTRAGIHEEHIPTSVISALGFDLVTNPSVRPFLRFRWPFSLSEVEEALANPDAYWIHPVPRVYTDRVREAVRRRWLGWSVPVGTARRLVEASPLTGIMPPGWLARRQPGPEADEELVLAAAALSLDRTDGAALDLANPAPYRAGGLVRLAAARGRNAARVPRHGAVIPMPDGPSDNYWWDPARPLEHFLLAIGYHAKAFDVATIHEALEFTGPVGFVALEGDPGLAVWAADGAEIESALMVGSWVALTDGADAGAAATFALDRLAEGRWEPVAWTGTAVVLEQTESPV
jgi:hypothetical protein